MDVVGFRHQGFQRLHSLTELFVIEQTDAEIDIFECLGRHPRALRHRSMWPAQHAPAGLVHPLIENRTHFRGQHLHFRRRNICHFVHIVAAANRDVAVH